MLFVKRELKSKTNPSQLSSTCLLTLYSHLNPQHCTGTKTRHWRWNATYSFCTHPCPCPCPTKQNSFLWLTCCSTQTSSRQSCKRLAATLPEIFLTDSLWAGPPLCPAILAEGCDTNIIIDTVVKQFIALLLEGTVEWIQCHCPALVILNWNEMDENHWQCFLGLVGTPPSLALSYLFFLFFSWPLPIPAPCKQGPIPVKAANCRGRREAWQCRKLGTCRTSAIRWRWGHWSGSLTHHRLSWDISYAGKYPRGYIPRVGGFKPGSNLGVQDASLAIFAGGARHIANVRCWIHRPPQKHYWALFP